MGGLATDDRSEIARRARDRSATPEALARRLRGDLDTIVTKALRKEPERRYASVEQLAADVENHLHGLPVRARADSLRYRAGKFVRRHRWGVVAVAAMTVLVLASATGALVMARQIARQRDEARRERDRANEVTAFVLHLFSADPYAASPEESDLVTLRQFLQGREQVVRSELADRPALRASLLVMLAKLETNLGHLDRARSLAQEGLTLEAREHGKSSAETATSLNALATVLEQQGDSAGAEKLFRRALTIRETLYGDVHPDVAESVNNLAVLLAERNRRDQWPEIERLERRGLELHRRLFGEDDLETAQSLNNLASFLMLRGGPGDLQSAETLYREALAIRIRKLGDDHPNVANTRNNLAQLLFRLGRLDAAEALFRRAIADWTKRLGPSHPLVSTGYFGLQKVLAARGDRAGAIAALRRSMAIDAKTLPPGHPYLEEGRARLRELEAMPERGP